MSAPLYASYEGLLCDLDGVVYLGDRVVPEAPPTFRDLARAGARFLFVTNNSARSAAEVAQRLRAMGIDAGPERVLTSGQATADMLVGEGSAGASAFVVGEAGLRDTLSAAGLRVVDGQPSRADLVIVGWDRSFDYEKCKTAALLVQRGARLVGTNPDVTLPETDGLWPGAGALLAAVVAASGAEPTIVGKPDRPMFEVAAGRLGVARPLVVGDRLGTDVSGASGMGWDGLLVWSGVSAPPDLLTAEALPTYTAADVSALLAPRPRVDFRPAGDADLAGVGGLLQAAGLQAETVVAGSVVGVGPDGRILATARLEPLGEDGLLRSVAVADECRGLGLGGLAVAHAVRAAPGLARVGLFTEGAEPFFEWLGFRAVERDALPPSLRSHPQASACPGASAMLRDLAG